MTTRRWPRGRPGEGKCQVERESERKRKREREKEREREREDKEKIFKKPLKLHSCKSKVKIVFGDRTHDISLTPCMEKIKVCLDKWILYIKISNVTQVGGALMVIWRECVFDSV